MQVIERNNHTSIIIYAFLVILFFRKALHAQKHQHNHIRYHKAI